MSHLADVQKTREKSAEAGGSETTTSPTKIRRNEEIKAVRISNNRIERIDVIFSMSLTVNFEAILWLDISFNGIKKISKDLAVTCPNLTTLYMQANQVTKISNLKVLHSLTKLKSLTLFGNPVEESKHYRNMIFYQCPGLHQLDFTPITAAQRKKVTMSAIFQQLRPNHKYFHD